MLRLVGFFLVAVLLARVLAHVPLIGGFFRATGFIGVWITAILLSLLINYWGRRAVVVRRDGARMRELRAVASPRNRGKIGALLLGQGRPRKAVEPLRDAVAGEPDVAEWQYRLGLALLRSGSAGESIPAFERCLEIDGEYAYGDGRLRLAEAQMREGRHEDALASLERFDRDHGPRPESAYRRGVALKTLGRRDEARAAFGEVGALAAEAARYQRKEAGLWTVRARLASLF